MQTPSCQRQWSPFCPWPLEADWDLMASETQQQTHTNHLQELSLGLKDAKCWEIPAELKSLPPNIGPGTAGEPAPCPDTRGGARRATCSLHVDALLPSKAQPPDLPSESLWLQW